MKQASPRTRIRTLKCKQPPDLSPVALVHPKRMNDLPAMQAAGGNVKFSGITLTVNVFLSDMHNHFVAKDYRRLY